MNGIRRINMPKQRHKLVIVTGGAGFIGSCILKELNIQGYENIIVVDELEKNAKWKNLVGKKFNEYLHKDQLFEYLDQVKPSEVGCIIHMGACSSTVETDVDYLMENNYRYTLTLAKYALKHKIRFIYASSAATYGDGSKGFSDDENRLEELEPLNAYGFSKHLFDLWAKDQGVLNQITGLKFFNVFGPNEYHKERMASVVFNLLPQVQNENLIKLFKSNDPENFKDGDQCRDFVYVKDVAKITVDLIDQEIYGIYNLGSGDASTWNSVASGMFRAIGRDPNIHYRDMPKDLDGKYQNYTKADMEKLSSKLKNIQFTPLHEAIDDYITNHLLPEKTY